MESSDHILPYITPTSKLTSVNLLNMAASKEDVLFTYLNTPDPSPKKIAESFDLSKTSLDHPTNDTDSELSTHSDQISPIHTSLEMVRNALDDKDAENENIAAENENLCLSSETQMLNCEYLTKPITDALQNGIFLFAYMSLICNIYNLYVFLHYRTQNRRTFEYFLSST